MEPGNFDLYRMSEERQKELWADCLFVFDTSALLSLYLYPEDARQYIYREIFERVKDRLWIPHHVLFEFLKNKSSKIREPISRNYKPLTSDYIQPVVEAFGKSLNRIDALKNVLKNNDSHPHIVSEELEKYGHRLRKFLDTTLEFSKVFQEQTEQKIHEIQLLEQHDTVAETVQQYFKVGREYSHDEIMAITIEGKHRYEFKIPPGYEDLKDKIGTQIFADLIIWKQLLEHALKTRKNVVFICNDLKEDWWHLVSDQKNKFRPNGPRKELIKEFRDTAGGSFWIYSQARFLDLANTLIRSNVPNRYIEQVSRLSGPEPASNWLVYRCDQCGREDAINVASLPLNFKPLTPDSASDPVHAAVHAFSCRHCQHALQVSFEVAEQPTGVIGQKNIVFTGASLVAPALMDENWEETLEETSPPEEIVVLDKKRLRLTAGIRRSIRLKQPIDSGDALFLIDCLPSGDSAAKRLLIEALGPGKFRISKTLVLQQGQTRFILVNNDSPGEPEISSLRLTAGQDMTILLSLISYPGSGRYAEKLYY